MDKLNFRRHLRRNATAAEVILWQALRNKQVKGRKFRRQHTLGNFIVDFYCPEEKLVIESDGEISHNTGAQQAYEIRDEWLLKQGYKFLRFESKEVYKHLERVEWAIEDSFNGSSFTPSS